MQKWISIPCNRTGDPWAGSTLEHYRQWLPSLVAFASAYINPCDPREMLESREGTLLRTIEGLHAVLRGAVPSIGAIQKAQRGVAMLVAGVSDSVAYRMAMESGSARTPKVVWRLLQEAVAELRHNLDRAYQPCIHSISAKRRHGKAMAALRGVSATLVAGELRCVCTEHCYTD